MAVPYGPDRDVLFFFQTIAIFTLTYVAFKMSQRSRETGFLSATTGLCALLIGIVWIQIVIFHALFYAPDEERSFVTMLGDIFAMVGLAFFVIFVEIDQARGIPGNARTKHPYRYTHIVLVMVRHSVKFRPGTNLLFISNFSSFEFDLCLLQ